MSIDWTKPCETGEDPPRPVRVLFDKEGRPDACRIEPGAVERIYDIQHIGAEVHATCSLYSVPLRNVAPPKPEPVLLEAWVNLYSGGTGGKTHGTKATADNEASSRRLECRRIAWMSDGSPVPASPEQFDQMREMAKLITDRDHWKAKAEALQPVVDAAVAWAEDVAVKSDNKLCLAVNAYKPIENWKPRPAEPVKNCTTCRYTYTPVCIGCFRYTRPADNIERSDLWEDRHAPR